tara:strand:- start:4374 stop:5696 length:1323 start_codon:yes stop_codon:yes gene_type:complete
MAHKKHRSRRRAPPINAAREVMLLEAIEQDLAQQYQDAYDIEHSEETPNQTSEHYPPNSELKAEQYLDLFHDPYHRFMPHQHLMGHALINIHAESPTAQQFNPPVKNAYGVQYTQINNIRLFEYQGQPMALGDAEDGTPMIARRSIQMQLKENYPKSHAKKNEYDLLLFSPLHDHTGRKKYLGQHKTAPLLKTIVTKKEQLLETQLLGAPEKHKGGKVYVDSVSIQHREAHKRSRSQKKVMGKKSAQQIIYRFYQDYQSVLSPKMKNLMEYVIASGNNEWTHALGHRLCPLTRNPQQRNNLVAGPAWLNSKMNVTEKLIVHHAKHGQNKTTRLKCILDTLPGSDVIDKGFIKAKITRDKRKVTVRQNLEAWVDYPIYSHATDIPQAVLVSQALLEEHTPYCVAAIHLGKIRSYDDLPGVAESPDTSQIDEITKNLKGISL